MAEITLITGGCRSGKSSYAQYLAENTGKKRLYIATAPVLDEEMEQRVAQHREQRRGRGWDTLEETINIFDSLQQADGYDVVLCDCLTLWVNNLQYAASKEGNTLEEKDIINYTRDVIAATRSISAPVFFVTNEVGMGIVPADKITRLFRDLAGRCNQEIASSADFVVMVVSGIPLQLKGKKIETP